MLTRDDDYTTAGKPCCDFDDPEARVALVDALAKDGMAALEVLQGPALSEAVGRAAELLATVLGQDLDEDKAGMFRIARRVTKDKVISTVDTQTRHGHKTAARRFDGYKGHIGADPDSEIITATHVTPGNAGDDTDAGQHSDGQHGDDAAPAGTGAGPVADDDTFCGDGAAVYGDNAYGTGAMHDR